MRKTFEMTEADLEILLEASKPTPAMWTSGGVALFGTPEENANRAWVELGRKMGFKSSTVAPTQCQQCGPRFFTAEVDEQATE